MEVDIYFDYKKYGRPHQMFVQGLMTRGIIDPDEFDHLFNLCLLRAKGKDFVLEASLKERGYPIVRYFASRLGLGLVTPPSQEFEF